jgi:hypothetical protein
MIERGQDHVLYNDIEIMKLVKSPQAIQVLKQLQTWYDTRNRRKLMQDGGCEMDGIKEIEKQEFLELLRTTKIWLRPRQHGKSSL